MKLPKWVKEYPDWDLWAMLIAAVFVALILNFLIRCPWLP